jgi:hypothetical protein
MQPLGDEKGVSRNTQGGMVVNPPPAAAPVVREAELLLELLIVALDTPAHLGDEDQSFQGGIGRTGREEVFHWLGFSFGPFDQQPLFGARRSTQVIPVSRPNPHGGEARGQVRVGTFAPGERTLGLLRQFHGQCLDRNRLVTRLAAQPRWPYATTAPWLGRQRRGARWRMPSAYSIPSSVMPSRKWGSSPYPASASTTPMGTPEASA